MMNEPTAKPTVYFDTVGCFKNTEDSERAAGILEDSGYEIADSPDGADLIIVNTCGFIEDAKRESIEHIFDMLEYKKGGAKLIVSGCMAQRYADELATEIPEADALIGVNEYENIAEIADQILSYCGGTQQGRRNVPFTPRGSGVVPGDIPRRGVSPYVHDVIPAHSVIPTKVGISNQDKVIIGGAESLLTSRRHLFTPKYSAYLKVAEGCDNRCSYCSIPAIRGPYRSVPIDVLLSEAKTLVDGGAKEISLIAQDVSAYGSDFGGNSNERLPELLRQLAEISPASGEEMGLTWIRLLYCYEERITDELIEVIAEFDKICRYIDIPLQHASDRILKSMKRRTTRKGIEKTLGSLRKNIPEIAIRTTLMTGFPGETEADFEELCEFVRAQKFERLGVFAFSCEEGTAAYDMEGQVPREIAEERRDMLMQIQQEISREYGQSLVGKMLKVLVDELESEGVYIGRTEWDAPEIDCAVLIEAKGEITGQAHNDAAVRVPEIGEFVEVEITDAVDYDLIAKVV